MRKCNKIMSLIERDLAIRAIAEDMRDMAITENPDTEDTVEDWIPTAEGILSGVPDVELKIVFCKDCKHYVEDDIFHYSFFCTRVGLNKIAMNPYDYFSKAERWEE